VSAIELLPVALFACVMGLTLWLLPRISKRSGLQIRTVERSFGAKVVTALLLTAAIAVGLWLGGAKPSQPGVLLIGLVAWCYVMFMVFRPAKRA